MQPPARLRPPVTTAYRLPSVKQTAASGTPEDLDPRACPMSCHLLRRLSGNSPCCVWVTRSGCADAGVLASAADEDAGDHGDGGGGEHPAADDQCVGDGLARSLGVP